MITRHNNPAEQSTGVSGGVIKPGSRLIITADDFGLHSSVNEAIERAHREGVLSAASLMVAAPAAADAVKRARAVPSLRVGLHLVLADGQAILPREEIPDLTDADGRFGQNMAGAGVRIFLLPSVRRQLAAEIRAQFTAFAATGLTLDHVNTHKHFHLHPTILDMILKIGEPFGLKAMRLPYEAGAPSLLKPWVALVKRRLKKAGIVHNDFMIGIQQSGKFDETALMKALDSLPPGTGEIYLHPALVSGRDIAASMADYRHADEFAALVSPRVRALIQRLDVRLCGFSDLAVM